MGATDSSDHMYNWSNRGAWVKLAAPGCAYTGKPGPAWTWWCGTSFASPVVAGIAALIKSLKPGLSRSQIERALLTASVNVRGVSDGRIDAAKAVRSAANLGAPPPSPTPSPTPTPRATATPTPTATPDPNTWQGTLDADTSTRSRTFHLSGAVHLQLTWSSGADVTLTVTNSDGDTLVDWQDGDGQINWFRNVREGDFKVQVSEWSDTWTPFRVTIED